MARSAGAAVVAPTALESDDQAWDEFVARGPGTTHLQTSAWARVKAANGWAACRAVVDAGGLPLGVQILTRRAGRLPWRMGYVGRGPIGAQLTGDNLSALTARLRDEGRRLGLAYLVFEPEAEAGRGLEAELAQLGWRRASHVQPEGSRLLDLEQPEEALWAGLRSKWRQYVNKARQSGVRVVEPGERGLSDFYAIYADTYRRAGVTARSRESFSILWHELAPHDMAHLFIAESASGQAEAALLLLACGDRVAEVYGGSTLAGNDARANYLLKWEAIRRCRELGYREYDMYGIPLAGIAHFKAGFGGREVHYVGAWEQHIDPVRGRLVAAAAAFRLRWVRLRHGRAAARRAQESE